MSPVNSYTDYHAWCDAEGCRWNGNGPSSGNFLTRADANRALREHLKECGQKCAGCEHPLSDHHDLYDTGDRICGLCHHVITRSSNQGVEN